MKIANASLQMASLHASQQRHEVKESLRVWVGEGSAAVPRTTPGAPSGDVVTLSDQGKASQSADQINQEIEDAVNQDSGLQLIRSMIEMLTGRRLRVFDVNALSGPTQQHVPALAPGAASAEAVPATSQPAAPPGFGLEYERHETYAESEQTAFSAQGIVHTTDGREIRFQLDLSMSRSYVESSDVSLRLGEAARKTDPLVLNFAGTAAQLQDQRFSFDLNADGAASEQINFVAPGSGFLVFDRNRDGTVNDGSELFGPSTRDGFNELARLDSDGNGWIDESDAAFGQPQVWTRDGSTDRLQSLSEAGVGALSLARVSTPFDLKNAQNELLGQIHSSGIFLQENGESGTIQRVDLTA